jgi:hypothetical protein
MAVTSTRQSIIVFTGDVAGTEIANAANNATSFGQSQIVALTTGANTITVPVAVGYVATAVRIIPDPANTSVLTLKGVTGDTGVKIHMTDYTDLALDPGQATFVLNIVLGTVNCRLIWS